MLGKKQNQSGKVSAVVVIIQPRQSDLIEAALGRKRWRLSSPQRRASVSKKYSVN